MSATRADLAQPDVGTGTDELLSPVRIIPGELGADSPSVPRPRRLLPITRWHAWFDLVADRAAGHPSPRWVLEEALGCQLDGGWDLWWLTQHLEHGRWLLHCARQVDHDGGQTLVSTCGLSLPWVGPSENVADREGLPADRLPATLTRCVVCAEATEPAEPITLGKGVPSRPRQ